MIQDKSPGLSLFSLQCVLFLFFGGLGCVLVFLPLHMRDIGLTGNEGRIVSFVAPCVAIVGPLFAGPLVDRWGAGATQSSRHMRGLLASVLFIGAVAHVSLLFVPKVSRLQQRNPAVTFMCTQNSSFILQEKCQDSDCFSWPSDNFGSLFLSHCAYNCDNTRHNGLNYNVSASNRLPNDSDDNESGENYDDEGSGAGERRIASERNGIFLSEDVNDDSLTKAPPHLCIQMPGGKTICHVYTRFSEQLTINVSLLQSTNDHPHDDEWCLYPVGGQVYCHMPPDYERCKVSCDLDEPYTKLNSLMAHAKCQKTIGNDKLTFWSYLILRSIADIFPVTVVALLSSCVITACRDMPESLGPQLSAAALGIAIFPPFVLYAYLTFSLQITNQIIPLFAAPILAYSILTIIAAAIVMFDKSMPLAPVDFQLHSEVEHITVKGAGIETVAVLIVLILLGTLWSILDSYLPWHLLLDLKGSELLVALTLTAGALPSVPFLWYSEAIVNYCGHSNLFITAFTFYIIRFTGLVVFVNPWWVLFCEALEVFTLSIMWVTAMLYMKQLVVHHLTATGQALAVIAHFCLGRSIGAVVGGVLSQNDSQIPVYKVSSVIAAIIASVYFVVYHLCLKSSICHPSTATSYRNPNLTVQGTRTNGTYTPLKIYNRHDSANNNQEHRKY